MDNMELKKIVVVLGAGRTGTSVLMQILHRLGMSISEELTLPSEQNPMGGYEDSEIFNIHSTILKNLNTNQLFPLPDKWLEKIDPSLIEELKAILNRQIHASPSIWGFKDPRTALLLPLWIRIFNPEKIVPTYILSIRDPSSTIASLKMQYNQGEEISELFWLHKNCAALSNTGGNCFIVHYEDWFTQPEKQAQGLVDYVGLGSHFQGNAGEALKDVLKPNLNRSSHQDYTIKNEYVAKLYDSLKSSRGSDFDRERLMSVVAECQKAIDGFKGWYIEAIKYHQTEKELRSQLKSVERLVKRNKKFKKMETDLEVLTSQNNSLLKENKKYHEEIEIYRKQIAGVRKTRNNRISYNETMPVNDWKREALILRYSYSFRLGKIIINSVSKPGKNTVLMPYYLLKLIWDIISRKSKNKIKNELQQRS